ncbi:sugar isomerase domain-containing protein [Microbacterium lushaniae]|nr:sugar isomerase domain-containing protein [Microbacterium lushaniae]KAA9157391.1 sugar isomerase domain-containing protein [Microbacterium lushaniae]
MIYEYPTLAVRKIDELVDTQTAAIQRAVDVIAPRMIDGGILQLFATGHARLPVHEMAGRAGGLRPVNLIRMLDLAVHGGMPFSAIGDPLLERDVTFAQQLWDISRIDADKDVVLVASNSGINGITVEFARIARSLGVPVIALTSLAHTTSVVSRHPSGERLYEVAEIVIDNLGPAGDAALSLSDDVSVGAVSNLLGVVVVQMLTEGITRRYLEAGIRPPVYRSMNLPDGDAVNATIEGIHAERIRPIEP